MKKVEKKRKYTHRKGRVIPAKHGSILDEIYHNLAPKIGPYKSKRRKNYSKI